MAAIDFDSFDAETLENYRYVITTAAAWSSKVPPFYEEVARTRSFILWRRTDEAFGRPVLNERTMAAKLIECDNAGGKYYSTQIEGIATVFPETVIGLRSDWTPDPDMKSGESASIDVELGKGAWRVSLQYFSPAGFTLSAPGLCEPEAAGLARRPAPLEHRHRKQRPVLAGGHRQRQQRRHDDFHRRFAIAVHASEADRLFPRDQDGPHRLHPGGSQGQGSHVRDLRPVGRLLPAHGPSRTSRSSRRDEGRPGQGATSRRIAG